MGDLSLPRHVAIIMDGNGRWAEKRGRPRYLGHRVGARVVQEIVDYSARSGIEVLTLFAFSRENWRRPAAEVKSLMLLFERTLRQQLRKLHENRIRFRLIGERMAFSASLQRIIADAEATTAGNPGLVLQIAANYGGHWDIVEAVRSLARDLQQGRLNWDAIDESVLAARLAFSDLPDPDLYIRTGGEQRLSNFILWQAAYSELYFTEMLWPDFNIEAFREALEAYAERQRRFGMTGEQVKG